MARRKKSLVGTIDAETDPFLFERTPEPFAWCVYLGADDINVFWGDDCTPSFADYLRELPPCLLYCHNGGRFDFHFLLGEAEPGSIKVINGGIAEMTIGNCTLRDSIHLIPVALAKYQKTQINYLKFEREYREENRDEIVSYLIDDCRFLLELVTGARAMLGDKLTIGSAAIAKIKAAGIRVEKQNGTHDETFRPFYHGGRVEAIRPGIHKGAFSYIDINSAYPFAMLEKHPRGNVRDYVTTQELPAEPGAHFLKVVARSWGALPFVESTGALSFPRDGVPRLYYATGWEIAAGIETGTLEVLEVIECKAPPETFSFAAFVLDTYAQRKKAKAAGDKIGELVYKLLLNSGYGKFCSNPEKHYDWELSRPGVRVAGFQLYGELSNAWIHRKPISKSQKERAYFDVATGASITGFVRAMLWRALCSVREPIYCDTDSIMCADPGALSINATDLGSWKLEATLTDVAIAGKKLYAAKGRDPDGKPVEKIASKGARLSYSEIRAVARGEARRWEKAAPAFGLASGPRFVAREIRRK